MSTRMHARRIGRPSAAVSAATRARILAAARCAFASAGYGQASNRQIAAAAGITPPALYHWFDSKAALFAAVQSDSIALLLEAYRAAAASAATCVDRLCAAFAANASLNREHPGLAEFLASAPLDIRRHPELARTVTDVGTTIPRLFRGWIEEGVRTGELHPELDVGAAVGVVTALSFGLAWLRGTVPDPAEHDAMLRHAERLIRGTLFRK
ncbi:MAG: TetR/AcrR family transcriptional regulator [Thermodesulfobacteriota bacterium]